MAVKFISTTLTQPIRLSTRWRLDWLNMTSSLRRRRLLRAGSDDLEGGDRLLVSQSAHPLAGHLAEEGHVLLRLLLQRRRSAVALAVQVEVPEQVVVEENVAEAAFAQDRQSSFGVVVGLRAQPAQRRQVRIVGQAGEGTVIAGRLAEEPDLGWRGVDRQEGVEGALRPPEYRMAQVLDPSLRRRGGRGKGERGRGLCVHERRLVLEPTSGVDAVCA